MLKLISATLFLLGLLTQNVANAESVEAYWLDVTALPSTTANSFVITGAGQSSPSTVTYSSHASQIWYYNGNIIPQSPENIQDVVETQYGLTSGSLTSAWNYDFSEDSDSKADSFTGKGSFDYLAIHFGQGELLFHWDTLQTDFSIAGVPRGLSNYRAYLSTSPVPEPETYGMMLMGLGLMGFIARRRRNGQT